jgi:solute carrier family 7 (L-type amino acid transporter), member 9/15
MNFLPRVIDCLSFIFGDKERLWFQTPLIIPILALLASIFLVFVPIVTDPRIEFLYAFVLIAIGLVFWLPFVYFKKRLRCVG